MLKKTLLRVSNGGNMNNSHLIKEKNASLVTIPELARSTRLEWYIRRQPRWGNLMCGSPSLERNQIIGVATHENISIVLLF